MPRQGVPTSESAADISSMFSAVVTRLGSRQADSDVEESMLVVPLDGVPFGQRPVELRRPGSSQYFQTYLEARATIRAFAELGLTTLIVNVARLSPPAPDLRVDFRDSTVLVEHAMIIDERANEIAVAIEDANLRVRELAAMDPVVADKLDHGVLVVRLNSISYAAGIDVEVLAAELFHFVQTIRDDVAPHQIRDATIFPYLTDMQAYITYRSCAAKTASPIQAGGVFLDRPSVFASTFRSVLERKVRKSTTYARTGEPLWLVLSIGSGFEFAADERGLRAVVADIGIGAFDRLIVQRPRLQPLIFPDTA